MNALLIIGYAVATLIPLFALYIIYSLDLYKTGNFRFVLLCFAFGGLAVWGAGQVNQYLYNNRILTYSEIVRFAAPVIEELLKALILFYLITRVDFTYFVDGAIYGFGAGIGFAVLENYFYLYNNPGAELSTAIGRVVSANLIHASASALIGIALGLGRFEKPGRRIGIMVLGVGLAIALHGIFNNLVDRVTSGLLLTIAAAGIGLGAAALIAVIMRRGLAEEKQWIEEKLGAADRVTKGEAAAVQKLETIQDVLAPLQQRFGEEKAGQIEMFLTIQARLGILRKTLEKLTDERMRSAVEKQMAVLRTEMDAARRQVGAYAMLYLRHTIPPDASPLWNRLENLIQERIAARPSTGGPSVWSRAGTLNAAQPGNPVPDSVPTEQPAGTPPAAKTSTVQGMFTAAPARPASPAGAARPASPFGKAAPAKPSAPPSQPVEPGEPPKTES